MGVVPRTGINTHRRLAFLGLSWLSIRNFRPSMIYVTTLILDQPVQPRKAVNALIFLNVSSLTFDIHFETAGMGFASLPCAGRTQPSNVVQPCVAFVSFVGVVTLREATQTKTCVSCAFILHGSKAFSFPSSPEYGSLCECHPRCIALFV